MLLAEWLHHYASDLKQAAARRDQSVSKQYSGNGEPK